MHSLLCILRTTFEPPPKHLRSSKEPITAKRRQKDENDTKTRHATAEPPPNEQTPYSAPNSIHSLLSTSLPLWKLGEGSSAGRTWKSILVCTVSCLPHKQQRHNKASVLLFCPTFHHFVQNRHNRLIIRKVCLLHFVDNLLKILWIFFLWGKVGYSK